MLLHDLHTFFKEIDKELQCCVCLFKVAVFYFTRIGTFAHFNNTISVLMLPLFTCVCRYGLNLQKCWLGTGYWAPSRLELVRMQLLSFHL